MMLEACLSHSEWFQCLVIDILLYIPNRAPRRKQKVKFENANKFEICILTLLLNVVANKEFQYCY